jgi:Fe-S cluster assembly iron-binding protein IscA
MDRLRTGMYRERSEFVRVIVALGGCAGFELFHVVSVTAVILFSDMAAACSSCGSSARFSRRLASYEPRL